MKQEEVCREMKEVMGQLSLDQQRYLLDLARAAKKAESCLDGGPTHGGEASPFLAL